MKFALASGFMVVAFFGRAIGSWSARRHFRTKYGEERYRGAMKICKLNPDATFAMILFFRDKEKPWE